MKSIHNGMVLLKKCQGVAAFSGYSPRVGEDEKTLLAITIANIIVSTEVLLARPYDGQGVDRIDDDLLNRVFEGLVNLTVSLQGNANDVSCRVLTEPDRLTRTLWIFLPRTVERVGLLERVGQCVDAALEKMEKLCDPGL